VTGRTLLDRTHVNPNRKRRRKTIAVAVFALLLVIAVGLAFLWGTPAAPSGDATKVTPLPVAAAPTHAAEPLTRSASGQPSAEVRSPTLVLLDAADEKPLANHAVSLMWIQTLRARTDENGALPLPGNMPPPEACFAADGYYPENVPASCDGTVRVRRHVVVPGFVTGTAIDPTGLVVEPRCRATHRGVGGGRPNPAVGADLRFTFTPTYWTEHQLDLCWLRDGRQSAPIATGTWRPGDATVSIHVAAATAPPTQCRVTVELVLEPGVQDAIDRARVVMQATGRELDPYFSEFRVELEAGGDKAAPGPRIDARRSAQRRARRDGNSRIVDDLIVPPGDWVVVAYCSGVGLWREFGPFTIHEPETRLRCVVDSGGELDVQIAGGGVPDLSHNPVSFLVRDARGELIGAFSAADGSPDPTSIAARLLPTGSVSVWAQAGRMIDGKYRSFAARPLTATLRKGERPLLACTLVEAAVVRFEHGELRGPLTMTFVDPVTGSRWRRHLPDTPRSGLPLAPGEWSLEVECEGHPPLHVRFVARPGENMVRLVE
jgi:hypothetical protein